MILHTRGLGPLISAILLGTQAVYAIDLDIDDTGMPSHFTTLYK